VLSSDLVAAVGPGGIIDRALARAGSLTERFGVTPDDLRGHLRVLAGAAARSAAHIAEVIASATASAVLGLLFAMLAMHYGLRHGRVYLVPVGQWSDGTAVDGHDHHIRAACSRPSSIRSASSSMSIWRPTIARSDRRRSAITTVAGGRASQIGESSIAGRQARRAVP
jgi:hypothetical protein